MKAMQNLQTVLDQRLELISAYFDRLTPRDRVLAIFLVIFVLVSSIGSCALVYPCCGRETAKTREPAQRNHDMDAEQCSHHEIELRWATDSDGADPTYCTAARFVGCFAAEC